MGDNGVMNGGGMGPADFAALLRNNIGYGYNDGFGGGCSVLWIVVLFFALMWGGNGMFGNNNFQNAIGYENLATSNEVQRGFDNQNSMANEREILAAVGSNAMQGMQNSNQNTQYISSKLDDKYNEIQRDIATTQMLQQQSMANQNECCCSTKMLLQENAAGINAGLAQNRYDAAINTSQIIQAVQQEGAATRQLAQQEFYNLRDRDQQNRIDALTQRLNDTNLQLQLAGVARMPLTATYNAGPYPFCTCGMA